MNIENIKDIYDARDGSLYGKKNIEDSLAILYHENSKFTEIGTRKQVDLITEFTNDYIAQRSSQPYKVYPGHETINLNKHGSLEVKDTILDSLRMRRSVRSFSPYKLSIQELSTILYNSYGVTYRMPLRIEERKGHLGMRNIPSGGGLYPLEIYVVIFNSEIESGLYHYRPDTNSLELIRKGHLLEQLSKIILAEPYVNLKNASALILTSGIIERLMIKYGERSYRFLLMETGFLNQTLTLLTTSLELGSCMIGGFNDDRLNDFLGLDGVFETVVSVMVIGKKKSNE